MMGSIKKGDYAKYPPPEGFPELKELIREDLGLVHGFDALITAGGTDVADYILVGTKGSAGSAGRSLYTSGSVRGCNCTDSITRNSIGAIGCRC